MRNALQEQLLKTGLAKKSKLDQVAREQTKARLGKAPAPPKDEAVDAERLRQERVERDRALQAERNAQARDAEQRAQARQIIEQGRVAAEGDSEYRFTDGQVIRSILVGEAQRRQLAKGALVIVRFGEGHALVPRATAEKVEARDAGLIVLDHGRGQEAAASQEQSEDEAYYSRFVVPDDLVW